MVDVAPPPTLPVLLANLRLVWYVISRHGAISQKTRVFNNIARRASDLAGLNLLKSSFL
jgi:hypothetical protein